MTNSSNVPATLEFQDSKEKLEFTGERYVPGISGPIQHEHHHRYLIAAEYCQNMDVLDIACGEGYGSALIATVANNVVGADVDAETVEFAQKLYGNDNLRFLLSDATEINLPDNAVDVVVSFETIEHFSGHKAFISEVQRVLRPGGLLIISSPNRPVYTDEDDHHNEFHVRELDREEFRSLLAGAFTNVELWEQRAITGSVVSVEQQFRSFESFETADGKRYTRTIGIASPHYFIALASDRPLPNSNNSLLINRSFLDELNSHIQHVEKQMVALSDEKTKQEIHATALANEVTTRDQEIVRLQAFEIKVRELSSALAQAEEKTSVLEMEQDQIGTETTALSREIAALNHEVSTREHEISRLLPFEATAIQSAAELLAVKSSTSFKIASRLIQIISHIPGIHRFRPYIKGLYLLLTFQLATRLKERREIQLINECGYFDPHWYASVYPDVLLSGMNPIVHFVRYGGREGREPSPIFSVAHYRKKHPELKGDKNILVDAIVNGRLEDGHIIVPKLDFFGQIVDPSTIELQPVVNPRLLLVLDARTNNNNIARQLFALVDEDSHSTCEVVALIEEGDRLTITGVKRHVCRGSVGEALDLLAKSTSADILLYLADFVVPAPGMIDNLLKTFDSRKLAVLTPRLLDPTKGRVFSAGMHQTSGGFQSIGAGAEIEDYRFCSYTDIEGFLPATFALRIDALAEVGGLKKSASALQEALDATVSKLRNVGWQIGCQSQALAYIDAAAASSISDAYQIKTDRAGRKTKRPRILFLDAFVPTPDKDSGSNDIINFMRIFMGFGYDVTFLPVLNLNPIDRYTSELRAMGVIYVSSPMVTSPEVYLRQHAADFDVIFAYRGPIAAGYVDLIRRNAPATRLVFDTVDLHFLREQRQAEIESNPQMLADANRTKQIEIDVIGKSDATIVLSRTEQDIVKRLVPDATTYLIPIVREVPGRSLPWNERAGVLFVGGFSHAPNTDAILWFVSSVWPMVRERLPHAELTIVGSNVTREISALTDPEQGIRVLGFVQDITPLMEQSLLSIAPLRYGAGIKGKVVSSLCHGLPCVATSMAVEGMGLEAEDGVIVADNVSEQADAIVALHEKPELWNRLSDRGISFAQEKFSIDQIRRQLEALLIDMKLPIRKE